MPRNRFSRLLGAVLVVLCLLSPALAGAVETVRVRAARHDDFGRIVFDWPAPTTFEANIRGGALRVTFARPLSASFAVVRRHLAGYVGDVKLSTDGRTVTFSLTGEFALRSFVAEKSIVVDLLGGSATSPADAPAADASAADAPAAAAPAPPSGPRVPVRVGEHSGFSRVVFDWRQAVGYRVSRDGALVIVRFDRPAAIDLTALNEAPPPYVEAGKVETDGKRAVVTLTIAEEARLRHFRSGMRVVLDVLAARGHDNADAPAETPAQTAASASPAEAPRAPPPAEVAEASRATAEPDTAPSNPPSAAVVGELAAAGAEPGAHAADVVPGVKAGSEPAGHEPAGDEPAPPGSPTATEAASGPHTGAAADPPRAEARVHEPVDLVGAKPAKPVEPEAAAANAVTAETVGSTVARLTLGPPAMRVTVDVAADGAAVSFNGGTPIASAAFIRNGHLWVVFPRRFGADLSAVERAATPAYDSVARIRHSRATVFRFKLGEGYGVGFRRHETVWVAEISRRPEPPTAIEVRPIDDEERGVGVQLLIADVSQRVQLNDPDDGAALVVVPIVAPATGVVAGGRYEKFDLLATTQGIALRPMSRGIDVRTSLSGVEIVHAVKPEAEQPATWTARLARRTRSAVTLFDYAGWRQGDEAEFLDAQQKMLVAVATAPEVRRTRARMAYVRFLFAHGYFPETLGALRVLVREDRAVARDPLLRAIRGVARLMLERYEGAAADLNAADLDAYDDVALWRGVLTYRQGDLVAAAVQFVRAGDLWLDVPPPMRNVVGRIAAETAIAARNLSAANAYLDGILAAPANQRMIDRATYLRGRALLASGNEEAALEAWDAAAQSADRFTRARVLFHRTLLELEKEKITPDEAIAALEGLRFTWRGDDFELALLQQLAELYFTTREYDKGLDAMKQAVTHFSRHPAAKTLASRMSRLFADIFLEGGIEDLPARKVLTLFYGFRELTPVGSGGDKVIQALVDRLVAVDLLGQAAELLEHLVAYRLEGVEKARVGAQLAVIRLMDQKPEAALDALKASAMNRLPKRLANQRRHLRARALSDLGRDDETLKLLAGDKSRDAELLRADIYWRTNDWPRTVAALRRILAETPLETPLSPFASQQILRLAVALALKPDRAGLRALRKAHAARMAGDPNQNTFDIVTGEVDTRGLSLREMPAAIAQVERFETFMADYRARARNGSFSAIN